MRFCIDWIFSKNVRLGVALADGRMLDFLGNPEQEKLKDWGACKKRNCKLRNKDCRVNLLLKEKLVHAGSCHNSILNVLV